MKRSIRSFVLVLSVCFLLTGCWQSKADLIPDNQAVLLFDGADQIIWKLLKNNKLVLIERVEGENNIYSLFNPDNEEESGLIKFFPYEGVGVLSGKEVYVVGLTVIDNKTLKRAYLYSLLVKNEGEWVSKTSSKVGIEVDNLEDLISSMHLYDTNGDLKKMFSQLMISTDEKAAKIYKQEQMEK